MYDKRYLRTTDPERVQLESDGEDSNMGIYPHPTVRVIRPGHNSWKEALTEIARRKTFLATLAAVIAIILLIVVIVISVGGDEPDHQETGLMRSYPYLETGGIIRFKPDKPDTYAIWMTQLEDALSLYNGKWQTPTRDYMHCNLREKEEGKYCHYNVFDSLGTVCDRDHDFGYSSGRPCLLLQLKLAYVPGKVEAGSDTERRLQEELGPRFDMLKDRYVGLTCNGKTGKDDANLRKDSNVEAVEFHPVNGTINTAFYPTDLNDDKDLAPIVMVHFSAMQNHVPVNIVCTAWAQNKFGVLPKAELLFKTEFTILIE